MGTLCNQVYAALFDEMKGIEISDAKVTIRSTMTAENEVQLAALADSII